VSFRLTLMTLAAVAALAEPAAAKDIFVTTTADGLSNNGNCTLREAIKAANTNAAVDTCAAGEFWPVDVIVLSDSVTPYRLTITGADDSSGDLDIYSQLEIAGAPSTIDASGLGDRALDLRGGAVVKLVMVDLRGGDAGSFHGGGIYVGGGSQLLVFGSSIRGNRAALGAGVAATGGAVLKLHDSDVSSNSVRHGIYLSSATLELVDSTVADNDGAGITASGSIVTLVASTISGNSATGLHAHGASSVTLSNATVSGNGRLDLARGGGLLVESPATASLFYSTVAGNDAMTGGGVNVTGSLTLKGSILGANRAAVSHPDCYSESATMTSQGHNVIHREDCGLVPLASDRIGSDPKLDVLADWGGSTRTRRLLPGSPALDNGDPANFPLFDQRTEGRPRHGDSDAVSRADIGAHENGNTIVVNNSGDSATPSGNCSLRDAIRAANTNAVFDGCRAGFDRDLIWIDDMQVGDVFLALTGADGQAAVGDLDVLQEVDIAGLPGLRSTIDGGSLERVFEVHAPARLRLSHLEVTRTTVFGPGGGGLRVAPDAGAVLFDVEVEGHSSGEAGGGALVEGELFGEDVWFHDNATNVAGGAIALDGSEALLDLRRARVTANQNVQGDGGGIAVVEGDARVVDSTVADNRAARHGGGIFNRGTLELVNATIASNRADSDTSGGGTGGGIDAGGTTRLRNTLLADNLAPSDPDCKGTLLSSGSNLIGDASCSIVPTVGDQLDVDAELGPPSAGFYATLPGSPARDAASAEVTGSLGVSCSRRDGAGVLRPVDGDGDGAARCDIGAIEGVGIAPLDVDGDGTVNALGDGILILRFLFGFTGDALTVGAVTIGAPRDSSSALIAYMSTLGNQLDVDGNGTASGLTDGILVLRYLFGMTGSALTSGAIGVGATRTTAAQIIAYLDLIS
jgi:CSLREA domain-containing protein